jgi:hypothetical protein
MGFLSITKKLHPLNFYTKLEIGKLRYTEKVLRKLEPPARYLTLSGSMIDE